MTQRFRGVRDALPPCSFTTISYFPSAFFACFAQHYSIFAFTDHLLGSHFTYVLGVEVFRLWREEHTIPLYRLRKRLGMIKIQILHTCSPVVLTEVEGRICEQIRCICVSNSQEIFHSAPLVGEWTRSNYHHNVCGREVEGRRSTIYNDWNRIF